MSYRCPHPDHTTDLVTFEALLIHCLDHIIHMETRMSLDLSTITTAVTDTADAITEAVALMNSIAARLGAAGNSPDQSAINQLAEKLETAATGLKAATTADTPPADPAPNGGTPAPAEPVQALDAAGHPLYEHVGDPATIDATAWPVSTLHAVNGEDIGEALYTFTGDTTSTPTGASTDWVPYTGTTV